MVYIYIYANIGGILMVNVTLYSIHGSYRLGNPLEMVDFPPSQTFSAASARAKRSGRCGRERQ